MFLTTEHTEAASRHTEKGENISRRGAERKSMRGKTGRLALEKVDYKLRGATKSFANATLRASRVSPMLFAA